ncbi:hypothetical protein HJC23_009323, partial [Cyclotella cryptica]
VEKWCHDQNELVCEFGTRGIIKIGQLEASCDNILEQITSDYQKVPFQSDRRIVQIIPFNGQMKLIQCQCLVAQGLRRTCKRFFSKNENIINCAVQALFGLLTPGLVRL